MQIAFVIFDQMTALDFVGIYDPLTRIRSMGFIPTLTWDICSWQEDVHDGKAMKLTPTKVGADLGKLDES